MAIDGTDVPTTERPTGEPTEPSEPGRADSPISTRYELGEPIGRGGMGEVIAAFDKQIGREVAIKRMRSQTPTAHQLQRFLREARVQGRLDHPAVVPVHDLGIDDKGMPFFAMKKVSGTPLSKLLGREGTQRVRLLRAFVDACLAIEFAHTRGVIHRDLKPENIWLGDYGEVYVLDWGIAKIIGESDDLSDLRSEDSGTLAGGVLGTKKYMSPEQGADATQVDARTDVFALGRVLSEMILTEGELPPELVELAGAALEDDREQRIATARELGDEVQRYLDGDRDLALRQKLARDQLEQARTAFAAGVADEDRRIAIRAASSAMALDPTLRGAAELVGRLMLEPPRSQPREVQLAIAHDDDEHLRAQGRAAMWSSLVGIVLMVPTLLMLGSTIGALVLAVLGAFNLVTGWRSINDPKQSPPPPWLLAVMNCAVIAVIGRLFSPLLVVPPVVVLVGVSLSSNPFLESRRGVAFLAAMLAIAALGPAIVEQLGWVSATMETSSVGLAIVPFANMHSWGLMPLLVVYTAGGIVASLLLGRFTRSKERALRTQLHLQTWQLRQLVADPLAV
jgi:eukaryotic-like serine/threonine-protein kinase